MKRPFFAALLCAVAAFAACSSHPTRPALLDGPTPLAVRVVESEIARTPSAANLDGIPAGKIKWNYTTGLELLAMMDAGEAYGRTGFRDYAQRYYDSIVQPDATVLT